MRSNRIIKELRSDKISVSLMMMPDDFVSKKLIQIGIKYSNLVQNTGPLIIDAVDLYNICDEKLLTYYPRILISPVFNRYDLITHIISREVINKGSFCLDKIKVEVNPMLSFVSASGLIKKKLHFQNSFML